MTTVTAPRFQSARISRFKESVIREMTRLALHHGAVNLAQGFPDFAAPPEVKKAAQDAIAADINQYPITWGAKPFRHALRDYYERFYGITLDPEREITVCCGSTEGMVASLLALLNPGDEIVLFEPFYENYWPDSQLSGAVCRYVRTHLPDWTFDPQELRAAFNRRTRAMILNTPNNPTGRVFSENDLRIIAELCQEFDCLLITDEIYEHILFDGARHLPPITLPGMRERCVLVNSLSKTFSVTGWRVGWVVAPPELADSIRKVHDFLTVGAAAPLQQAGVTALQLPDSYYAHLASSYESKRNQMVSILENVGFRCYLPKGAYYVMCDISAFGFPNDLAFAKYLVEEIGVAAVPGSSFFQDGADGAQLIRFCFAKRPETLEAAAERLQKLKM
ncbi:MAG: aminotransferase class I/II-fold pyridoxal phosphate-dependent enzyme [Acidobacteriaceae bacterium]|nr:aminotransferase class I/II-fold pyridoxal phosphate-dependent enzyme [Acidobacteriaceae bacterium]MBV9679684.1 aminotransferase class I/II-fold pyridoxal phosphate-dependent enzyme [Acidobacteriaceae bacterium]MBV9939546.1 aminotransferase class I/II-fold pyridoxal phosphate-dependent enzyme [Acidobacteriaceae bacterium]